MFLHRLARDLGMADVEALRESMSARQFDDWVGFYVLEDEQLDAARAKQSGG